MEVQEEIEQYIKKNKTEIAKELADVLYWVLLLSHDLDIDIEKISEIKLKETAKIPHQKSQRPSQ